MNVSMGVRWSSNGWTDTGPRRKVNQDALLERPDLHVWVVADGMGGHEAGEVASRRVIDYINGAAVTAHLGQSANAMTAALRNCNTELREYAEQISSRTVGSTVVAMIARGDRWAMLWAGDSRIYRLRAGVLQQITQDHSHVAALVAHGHLTEEEAAHHPQSNIITRAVGANDTLEVDRLTGEALPGDRYVLCSDGLTAVLSDADIAECVRADFDAPGKALADLAVQKQTPDNVTALVVRVD